MPKPRVVDPSFWDDPEVAKLSRDERLLLLGMITLLADDHGRMLADAGYMRKRIFGDDEDLGRTAVRVMRDNILRICRNFRLFAVESQEYIACLNWDKYQKIRYKVASKLPEHRHELEIPVDSSTSPICGNLPKSSVNSPCVGLGRVEKGSNTPHIPPQDKDKPEGLFQDAETAANQPSMVRPPVRAKRKKQTPAAMSAEQQARFAEFLSVHPRNTEQPAKAFKLWAEKVTTEEVFRWLMETLRRECVGDTTYMRGAGNWLEDHLTLWANGAQANIKQQTHTPDRAMTKGERAVRELWQEQQEGIL